LLPRRRIPWHFATAKAPPVRKAGARSKTERFFVLSMRSIGPVKGGADTVLDALMDVYRNFHK
jgi:aminoglycoside N3'-acetyltransferase